MNNSTSNNEEGRRLIEYYKSKLDDARNHLHLSVVTTVIITSVSFFMLGYNCVANRNMHFKLTERIIESIPTMNMDSEIPPIIQFTIDTNERLIKESFEPINNIYNLIFTIVGAAMITLSFNLYKIKNEYEDKLAIESAKVNEPILNSSKEYFFKRTKRSIPSKFSHLKAKRNRIMSVTDIKK